MENVTLTPKEQSRLQVLNSLAAEHMTLEQAAELMGVSSRHARRILAAYRERGAAALAHGHRGRRPANATQEALLADVVYLARTRYAGVNYTHLAELLVEREGIQIGRATLRRVLLDAGLSSPRQRRPPKHRVRRQRMPRAGMLIQMDGSHHPWLGNQAPSFTLLIAVDDATGTVVSARFCEQEDANNYFLLIRGMVERHGVPVALYTDRHAVFKHTPGAGLPSAPTQFSRAMAELGVQMIFAQSPQAKGRVERTAGTFQDRLVAELRLAGAAALEQAQAVLDEFVPRFNRRFTVPPQCSEPAFRPPGPEACLEQVLCSSTAGRWPRTTRCGSSRARSSCCQRRNVPAMPGRRWKSWRGRTASSGCATRDASSLPRKPRQVRYSFATVISLPQTLRPRPSV